MIHLVLVLLIPFLFTQMGGCQINQDMIPIELGPEVEAEKIDQALSLPLQEADPLTMQLGEGFILTETQALGGISDTPSIVADTSQTVIERSETADSVLMTIIEHKQVYLNDGVQKTSTEIPVKIEKNPSPESLAKISGLLHSLNLKETPQNIGRTLSANNTFSSAATKVTYHNLKIKTALEMPPLLVQHREDCAGIPQCQLKVTRVSFDMVFWDDKTPERVHWDVAMSSEAPYLASVLEKCLTGSVALGSGTGQDHILVRQCQDVTDFRYSAP